MDRLTEIEKKLDRVIYLLEGAYGSTGLVKEFELLKHDVSGVKKFVYKAMGAIAVITPIASMILKNYL